MAGLQACAFLTNQLLKPVDTALYEKENGKMMFKQKEKEDDDDEEKDEEEQNNNLKKSN